MRRRAEARARARAPERAHGARRWLALIILLVGAGMGAFAQPVPAVGCSMLGLAVDFDGTVVVVEGRQVSFRVDQVRQDHPGGADLLPEPGGTVVVHYERPTSLLRPGVGYRVQGWNARADEVDSQIAYDFDGDCGTGAGTTALDGTYLGPSAKGIDRWWPYATAGVVMVGVAALGVGARRSRRRGQPWHYL